LAEFILRPALAEDFAKIRRLIRLVRINPSQLDWNRFVVAVDNSGSLIACGQIKPHGTSLVELASIAVEPSHRHSGVARVIIEHLLEHAGRPVYLTCRAGLESFYQKWGFLVVHPDDMPAYYRRLLKLVSVLTAVAPDIERVLVMRLD
jgi:N-acetylglutamate synthase-like GNAT family acetyltransferase